MTRTLSALRDVLRDLPSVIEAEIEGEEPAYLRIELSTQEDVDVIAIGAGCSIGNL